MELNVSLFRQTLKSVGVEDFSESELSELIKHLGMPDTTVPTVILVHGKAGAGKTFISGQIVKFLDGKETEITFPPDVLSILEELRNSKTTLLAFADTLKEHLVATDKITVADATLSHKPAALRKILTSTADAMRQQYGSEYYAKTLATRIALACNVFPAQHTFVVHDLRYRHQLEIMEATGYRLVKITINAPIRCLSYAQISTNFNSTQAEQIAQHSSETDLDEWTNTKEEAEKHGFIWFNND